MKKRGATIVLGLLCVALISGGVLAGSSPNFAINWDVVARGGQSMASAHYAIQHTVSQTGIGPIDSSSYRLWAGYWYMAAGPAGFNIFLPMVLKDFD